MIADAGSKKNSVTAQAGEVVGGEADGSRAHVPVMLNEVIAALQIKPGELIVDGTFGGGGYSSAILAAGGDVVAIDKDPQADEAGQAFSKSFAARFRFIKGEFGHMDTLCKDAGIDQVDGVVLDIGVSSMQIDLPERGFSFQKDGPLDMRMGQSGISASDVVNSAEGKDLTRILGILGEERHAGRVSRAIVARREQQPILRTLDLARIVEKTIGRKFSDKIHPATRTFQALRVFVNRELEQLAMGLFAAERILKDGGRLVVVTFHSLEDRIVKQYFADRCGKQQGSRHLPQTVRPDPVFYQKNRSPVKPGENECATNPRARSAKLRSATRSNIPARAGDLDLFGSGVTLGLSRSIGDV